MKRNRVISLMLALAMILTFMPAMAFADSDNTGSARTGTIKEPQITDNGQKIPAEAQAKSLAAQGFIIVANLPETTATEWSVKSRWLMEDYKSEIDLYATLDGIKADNDTIYQWYLQKGNEWVELDENDSEFEVYKNNCCFTLLEDTNLKCAVTIDGLTSVGSFSVFIDTTDYEVETYNPGATATYTQKYGRALKVNYIYNSENFPNDGDTITINNNGEEEVYTCYFNVDDLGNDYYQFLNEDNEELLMIWDRDWDADVETQKIYVTFKTFTDKIDHEQKKMFSKYIIKTALDARITSNILSMEYEPDTITLDSEDVERTIDGETVYDLGLRGQALTSADEMFYSCYVKGDKLTVTYNDDDKTQVTYCYDPLTNYFVHYDDEGKPVLNEYGYIDCFAAWIKNEDRVLNSGTNTVPIWCRGVSTEITVILNTPLLEAQTDAKGELESLLAMKNEEDYDAAEWEDLIKAVTAGKEAIDRSTTTEDVAAELKTAKATIDSIKTKAEKAAEAAEKAAAEEKAKAEAAAAAAAEAEAKAKSITSVTVNVKKVNASTIAAAITAAGGKTEYVNTVVLGKKVKKISANTFQGTNVTKLTVKSKKLTKKSVKKSLKGSSVKTVSVQVGSKKVNKKYVKKYKKIFTKKNAGKKANVK